MSSQQSLSTTKVLRTKKELEAVSTPTAKFLLSASKTNFWSSHFSRQKFVMKNKGFNWTYWQKIPFYSRDISPEEEIASRLVDAYKVKEERIRMLILSVDQGKGQEQEKRLFLDTVSKRLLKDTQEKLKVDLINSYNLSLRQVLASLILGKQKYHLLLIDPKIEKEKIKELFGVLKISSVFADPKELLNYIDLFDDKKRNTKIKRITLTHYMKNPGNAEIIRATFPKTEIIAQHALVSKISHAVRSCIFAQEEFGTGAVHPRKDAIVELKDIGEEGYGEIVITVMKPLEVCLIKYRTGIFGKGVFKKCRCKSSITLVLKPVKRKFKFSIASKDNV